MGAAFNHSSVNNIVGTEDDETFSTLITAGPDLICGIGGDDHLATLVPGDAFLGSGGTLVSVEVVGCGF